jgi:hypothetical protein
VCLKCRGDFHHERLELGVLNRRQQRGLNGVDHGLVKCGLVLEEGCVERRSAQSSEARHGGGVITGTRIVLGRSRRDAEFRCEIATLLPHLRMVSREHGAEFPDFRGRAALHSERARFDVRGVRGVEDRNDGRVIER